MIDFSQVGPRALASGDAFDFLEGSHGRPFAACASLGLGTPRNRLVASKLRL